MLAGVTGLVSVDNGFSHWLESELDARSWRPADLARAAGLPQATVGNILNGNRELGLKTAVALALALDVPADMVLRRAGLLPPQPGPERDPSFQEIAEIMRGMSPDERREVVDYALWRFRRRGKGDG